MKKLSAVLMLIGVLLLLVAATAPSAQATGDNNPHKVWVCKYVGQPGDFETLKDGKQPIQVDSPEGHPYAVGDDFVDGQFHSVVIDVVTADNTDEHNDYIGEATCPTVQETTTTVAATTTSTEGTTSTTQPSTTTTVATTTTQQQRCEDCETTTSTSVPESTTTTVVATTSTSASTTSTTTVSTVPTTSPRVPTTTTGVSSTTKPLQTSSSVPSATCTEDMPCWNCHTMGNHLCGKPLAFTGSRSTFVLCMLGLLAIMVGLAAMFGAAQRRTPQA